MLRLLPVHLRCRCPDVCRPRGRRWVMPAEMTYFPSLLEFKPPRIVSTPLWGSTRIRPSRAPRRDFSDSAAAGSPATPAECPDRSRESALRGPPEQSPRHCGDPGLGRHRSDPAQPSLPQRDRLPCTGRGVLRLTSSVASRTLSPPRADGRSARLNSPRRRRRGCRLPPSRPWRRAWHR